MSGISSVLGSIDLFPAEMLPEMMNEFLSGAETEIWFACIHGDQLVGFCYAVQEQMTIGTWNMLALGVLRSHQGYGAGRALVEHLEHRLKALDQHLLIVDTSGSDDFAQTRQFYTRCGYEEEARIRDFWAVGDDKVTYRKVL